MHKLPISCFSLLLVIFFQSLVAYAMKIEHRDFSSDDKEWVKDLATRCYMNFYKDVYLRVPARGGDFAFIEADEVEKKKNYLQEESIGLINTYLKNTSSKKKAVVFSAEEKNIGALFYRLHVEDDKNIIYIDELIFEDGFESLIKLVVNEYLPATNPDYKYQRTLVRHQNSVLNSSYNKLGFEIEVDNEEVVDSYNFDFVLYLSLARQIR